MLSNIFTYQPAVTNPMHSQSYHTPTFKAILPLLLTATDPLSVGEVEENLSTSGVRQGNFKLTTLPRSFLQHQK